MAINVYTSNPQSLLAQIKQKIDEKTIETWAYDADGDFTHSAQQWNCRAWLRPNTENDRLVLNIITPKDAILSMELYAIYHGRFIEMLLAHFDKSFTRASASALPVSPDRTRG